MMQEKGTAVSIDFFFGGSWYCNFICYLIEQLELLV